MNTPVQRTYYEVSGDEALEIARAHYETVKHRSAIGFALAEKFGAVGYRPGHGVRGIMHLIFAGKEPPEGFKYAQREANGNVAAKPDKRTAVGKAAHAEMEAFENAPTVETLASALGYRVASAPMDGYKIYWPSAYRFLAPEERHFLDIPRQAGDGWEPPAHLVEVLPSVFMMALEAHNAAARAAQAEVA